MTQPAQTVNEAYLAIAEAVYPGSTEGAGTTDVDGLNCLMTAIAAHMQEGKKTEIDVTLCTSGKTADAIICLGDVLCEALGVEPKEESDGEPAEGDGAGEK